MLLAYQKPKKWGGDGGHFQVAVCTEVQDEKEADMV